MKTTHPPNLTLDRHNIIVVLVQCYRSSIATAGCRLAFTGLLGKRLNPDSDLAYVVSSSRWPSPGIGSFE